MRIGQYSAEDSEEPWVGVRLDEETVVNLQEAGVGIPRTTTELLAGWKWQKKAELAV